MNDVLTQCPVCREQLEITRLHCGHCETTIDGRFSFGRLNALNREQLAFVELFLRSEGKINRVVAELNSKYPHVRSQLTDVIETMGYKVGDPEPEPVSAAQKQAILKQVANGELSADQAAVLLTS